MLTKKTPTSREASWESALAAFDEWQRARGMGEKTRRAYGADLAQLGAWAAEHDLDPHELGHRELRRFASVLGESGAAKTTVAPYSLRGVGRPTVSTPITWDEALDAKTAADLRFDASDVVARIEELGDLFGDMDDYRAPLP